MKRYTGIVLLLAACLLPSLCFGQGKAAPTKSEQKGVAHPKPQTSTRTEAAPPGHSLVPSKQLTAKSYADSAAFEKAFKDLFTEIKPEVTIKEKTEALFKRNIIGLKLNSADSSKLFDSILRLVDQKRDEQILHDAYRANFSAEELKSLTTFFKTSAGKQYLKSELRLMNARLSEADNYVNGIVNRGIMPYRIAQRPPSKPQAPGATPGAPGTPASGASMRGPSRAMTPQDGGKDSTHRISMPGAPMPGK